MSSKLQPVVRLTTLAGGAYLLYHGIAQWVASRYVMTGAVPTSWYVETLGSLVSGALLSFGPGLAAAIKGLLNVTPDSVLGKLLSLLSLGNNPTPAPGPENPPNPLDNWMGLLINQLKTLTSKTVVGNPEFGLLTLMLLGKVARDTKSKQLLDHLRQTAHALVEEYFQDDQVTPAPKVVTPAPAPIVPAATV